MKRWSGWWLLRCLGIAFLSVGSLGCGDDTRADESSQAGSGGSSASSGGSPSSGGNSTGGSSSNPGGGTGAGTSAANCSTALPAAGGELENAVLMVGNVGYIESTRTPCDDSAIVSTVFTPSLQIRPAVGPVRDLNRLTTGLDTATPMFAARLGGDGSLIWSHMLPRNGHIGIMLGPYIAPFPDGSIVETGSFQSSVILAHGEPNEVRLSGTLVDGYLAKYAPEGALLWVKHIDVNGTAIYGVAPGLDGTTHALIEIGYSGGVLGPGEIDLELPGLNTVALATLDADGNFIRAQRNSGGLGSSHRVTTLPDGSVVVFVDGGTVVFAEGTPDAVMLSSGHFAGYFSPTLELLSAKALPEGEYNVALVPPVPFADGSVIIAADNLDAVPVVTGSRQVVARFDPAGKVTWALHLGAGSEASLDVTALAALHDGTTWIGGNCAATADSAAEVVSVELGLGSAQAVVLDAPGTGAGFVARIARDGRLEWAQTIFADVGAGVSGLAPSQSGVTVSGHFSGPLNVAGTAVASAAEDEGLFVTRLGP